MCCGSGVLTGSAQVDKRTLTDRATFKTAFNAFTHGAFENFDAALWDNVMVAGGAVLASLLPLEENFQRILKNDYLSPWAPQWYFVTRYDRSSGTCLQHALVTPWTPAHVG